MFTLEDVLSAENQTEALAALRSRHDGSGPNGMRLSALDEWHKVNGDRLEASIREGTYHPSTALVYEAATGKGKRREIASIDVVDRFVERLLQQQLTLHLDPTFSPHCFAYRAGMGPLEAALLARGYVEEGNPFVCEIDLKDYFTTIDLSSLKEMLAQCIADEGVRRLLDLFLFREVERHGRLERQARGLLQGASTSPVLSNLYLREFDRSMDEADRKWLRFSDNICLYLPTADEATSTMPLVCDLLEWEHGVMINQRKSGVFRATERRLLGYDLIEGTAGIEVRKHTYTLIRRHDRWFASSVYKDRDSYHLLQDGVLNRKDYSLLFENDDERHHIPVEVTSQINIYSNVTISPSALKTLCEHNIRIAYVDEYGDLMGTFVPSEHSESAEVFLKQCQIYTNKKERLALARLMEDASIHNMETNLRYYVRRGAVELEDLVAYIDSCQKEVETTPSIESLRLVEARARKAYYSAFAQILAGTEFDFTKRTRRPPKDPGNAMVSFGNTVLYNVVLQAIWRTPLDPKIGIVHATNRRSHSLNLDLADIFKPVLVDRVIFSLINRREIRADEHFMTHEDGGVFMNTAGKRVFLRAFEEKLDDAVTVCNRRITYRRLIGNEVMRLQRLIVSGMRYQPYKYR